MSESASSSGAGGVAHLRQGKSDSKIEGAALVGLALHKDAAAIISTSFLEMESPSPGAAKPPSCRHVGLREGVEQFFQLLFCHAHAGVADAEKQGDLVVDRGLMRTRTTTSP